MNSKIIAKRFFSLILMLSMVVSMMCMAPASAEVQADIILTTTGLKPDSEIPLYETMRAVLNGETATGYTWKYEGSTIVRGTEETFIVPSNFMDGDKDGSLAQKKLYCEITYSGGTVVTPSYPIEKYVNYIPHSDKNKDGKNSYAMLPNKQDSAEAYTFSVDGKRFVLADSRNVNDNAYFIMALDAYGDIFNGDTAGAQSTTAWKNYKGQTGFEADSDGKTIQDYIFTTGNNFESLGSDHETRYTLPLAFKDYINYNHSWQFASDKYGSQKVTTAGVNIPSLSDYKMFKDIVGWKDGMQDIGGASLTLIRDLYAAGSQNTNGAGQVVGAGGGETHNLKGPYLFRPCFWLNKTFFENNIIDLTTAGSEVIKILKDSTFCNRAALENLYTGSEYENEYKDIIEGPKADIILKTTGLNPDPEIPMYETIEVSFPKTATGYAWKYEGSETVRGTEKTFTVPSNFMDGDKDGSLAQKKLYCEVTYSGGTVETPHYSIEKYVNYIPHSYYNLDGKNFYKKVSNNENSNSDYVFSIDGKSFVLADTRNINDNAYFVVALDAYGDIYNGDKTEAQSTTAWKNYKGQTGFAADSDGKTIQDYIFTTGNNFENSDSDKETRYTLPSAFKDYINYNHSWPLCSAKNGSMKEYKTGVSILSYADYMMYSDKIGYKDNMPAEYKSNGVLLRDLVSSEKYAYLNPAGQIVTLGGLDTSGNGPYLYRPCFWLKKTFFENNVIDLPTAGSEVIKVLKNSTFCDRTTLDNTYQSAGKEADVIRYIDEIYPRIKIKGSNESGNNAKLYDTVEAVFDGKNIVSVTWEIYDGTNWNDASGDSVSGNDYIIMHDSIGKKIRAMVNTDDGVVESEVITIGTESAYSAPGTEAEPKTLTNSQNSNPDYIFKVGSKGFVLLDTKNNDVAKYYVTTTESYGSANSTVSGTRDPKKSYSAVGTFADENGLNVHLTSDGNTYYGIAEGEESVMKKYALPKEVSNKIYDNAYFKRYKFPAWPSWQVGDYVSGNIQMLSQQDFETYNGILGWKDNVFSVDGNDLTESGDVKYQYLLRDTCDTLNAWTTSSVVTYQGTTTQRTDVVSLVRPVFYLSGDFFKRVRLDDLENTGSAILNMMKEKYYVEDLVGLYSESKLIELGFDSKLKITDTWTDKNGSPLSAATLASADSLKVKYEIQNTTDKQYNSAVMLLAVYDDLGRMIGIDVNDKVNISPNAKTTVECKIDSLAEGAASAKAMLWNNLDELVPLSGARTIK